MSMSEMNRKYKYIQVKVTDRAGWIVITMDYGKTIKAINRDLQGIYEMNRSE